MTAQEHSIPGLRYVAAYLDADEQTELAIMIDGQPWLTDLKRRVQHYGYRYNYTRRTVDPSMYLGPLPAWAAQLAARLHRDGYVSEIPDQVIVNEYEPGQGISSHVDCVPCFGATILSISLCSPCLMLFTERHSKIQVPVLLESGSLVVMQDAARYLWTHSIPARKTDVYHGQKIVRGRRLSLTFRNILLHDS